MAFPAWFLTVWDLAKTPYLGRILEVKEWALSWVPVWTACFYVDNNLHLWLMALRVLLSSPGHPDGPLLTGHSALQPFLESGLSLCFVCLFLFFSYKCHSKECKIHLLSAQLLSREDKLNISQHFWGQFLLAITNLSLIKLKYIQHINISVLNRSIICFTLLLQGEKNSNILGENCHAQAGTSFILLSCFKVR